jgi:hypothetical protein
MVTKLGQLECGNYGEDTLTASKLEDGSVVIERTNKDGSLQSWTIGATDALRVSGKTFGDATVALMESFLFVNDVEISHFEINSQWGGTIIGEVAELARAVGAASGCRVTVIDLVDESPPPAPAPSPPSPPPPAPKVMLPVRAGADVLASLETNATEEGLVRLLRLANGTIVFENAFTGEAWTIDASDELLLTIWGLSPGPSYRTVLELSRRDEELASFHVWTEAARGLHHAQVVEFVEKITDLVGCKLRVHEEWG